MNRILSVSAVALLTLVAASRPAAQMLNKDAPVRVGHYHLNVTSVADHKKFWVDTLGGTATKVGATEAVKFGDVLLLLNEQKPTGGTRGTYFDHIGFAAPDVPALTKKIVSAGYTRTVGREPKAGAAAAPAGGVSAVYGRFEYLVGPDGVKVELVTATDKTAPPIAHHHVHFTNPQYVEMRDWYVKVLGATERTGPNTFTDFFAGADLPGIGYMLNFFRWEPDEKLTGTAGRSVDHVGFEVRNLDAFVKTVESRGVKMTQPVRPMPALGGARSATLVDPWGVVIELTEGLDRAL
jgi:catechol 2,3-dioxygenase-like lactoylglutathione lyase family enzyme